MKSLLIILSVIVLASSQGMGNGISKSTWGASNPIECLNFNLKYLPVTTAPDDCTNNVCECATQGRVQCDKKKSTSQEKTSSERILQGQPDFGFGIHAINCTYHPYGSMSLLDIENKFQENFQDFKAFHPYMDFNAGFWIKSSKMDTLISTFQADGVKFLPLRWTSDDGKEYFSILFKPCGYVVLELITDSVTQTSIFQQFATERFSFVNRNNKPSSDDDYLTAIKISRATASLDAVKSFYNSNIGATMLKTDKAADGSECSTFMYDSPTNGIQLTFCEGRKAVNTEGNGWTVKQLEDYILSVHKKIMINDVCGFDQFIDNHYAIDFPPFGSKTVSLDAFASNFKAHGLPYHWWKQSGGPTQLYGPDPTGWGIQIDGQATNPPANIPEYSAACKSTDGCSGQGNCDTVTVDEFLLSIINY